MEDGGAAEKYRACAAMDAAYKRTAESLCFRPPRIYHAAAVIVMALAFHTKDPDRVGDTLNIYFISRPLTLGRVGSGAPHA